MNQTKTSKEVYDALIAAGVQLGDLVRFNDETIGFVYRVNEFERKISVAVPMGFHYFFGAVTSEPPHWWPTHFARPCWSSPLGITFEAFSLHGEIPETTSVEIKYPNPLTLEQRIERLEKLQGVGK